MVSIQRITDQYNPLKVWVIKRYQCGHYHVNQEIAGRLFYKKFSHMNKQSINEIGLMIASGGKNLW